jgi:hypothetical protein
MPALGMTSWSVAHTDIADGCPLSINDEEDERKRTTLPLTQAIFQSMESVAQFRVAKTKNPTFLNLNEVVRA